ncbi:MAG: type III-A CRISPR-associated RAMP protein Csm5 [Bacteroidota bacterium]
MDSLYGFPVYLHIKKHKMKLKIETLTPIHIGSGRELLAETEYLFFDKERKVVLVDDKKVLDIVGVEHIPKWVAIIERGESLLYYLQSRKKGLKPVDIAKRIIAVPDQGPKKEQMREQMHDGMGRALLPGSSIKGSIRTAISTSLIEEAGPDINRYIEVKENRRSGKPELKSGQLKTFLTYPGVKSGVLPNKDIFRLIRPGDVSFHSTEVFRSTNLNKQHKGWQEDSRLSTFLECIPKGQVNIMTMTKPDQSLLKYLDRKDSRSPFREGFVERFTSWENISTIVNAHTTKLLQQEITFWENEGYSGVGTYLENLRKIMSQLEKLAAGTCIIRVGFGGGVNWMTGGWQEDLMDENKLDIWYRSFRKAAPRLAFPKTRKFSPDGQPLGFLKISPIQSDSELAEVKALVGRQKAQIQEGLLTVVAPAPTIPTEPLKAEFQPADAKIKKGSLLEAFVLPEGKGKKVKPVTVYGREGEEYSLSIRFAADQIVEKPIIVKVVDMKAGKVTAVQFIKPKS